MGSPFNGTELPMQRQWQQRHRHSQRQTVFAGTGSRPAFPFSSPAHPFGTIRFLPNLDAFPLLLFFGILFPSISFLPPFVAGGAVKEIAALLRVNELQNSVIRTRRQVKWE